jgi:hypothetical protein
MKLSTSLLTHLGAVAITVTTTALDRVSGVRWFVATRASRGSGVVVWSALWRVSRCWVGLVLRCFVRFVYLSHTHAMGQSS